MSSLAAFLVAASTVLGQATVEEEAATPKSLADDYIVGNWRMEGEVAGNPLRGQMNVRPSADGMCLIYVWRFKVKGMDEPLQATAIGGLDVKTNRFREYCFNSRGDHWVNSYPAGDSPDVGTATGERSGTIQGKPYEGRITIDRTNRDRFEYSVQSSNGPDMKYIFTRAEEGTAKSTATREQFTALGELLVGKWITESTTELAIPNVCEIGDTFRETKSVEWLANQTVLLEKRIYEIKGKVVAEGAGLIALNAPTAQIDSHYVDSLGGSWHSVLTKTDQGFTSVDVGVFGDGRKTFARVTATASSDGSILNFKRTDQILGEQKMNDKETVSHRVTE